MEVKKSPNVNLQNYRMLFLLVGLALVLGITGVVLSIPSARVSGEYTPPKAETTEVEQIDNTRQDIPEPEVQPQKAQAQVVTDVLNIVMNRIVSLFRLETTDAIPTTAKKMRITQYSVYDRWNVSTGATHQLDRVSTISISSTNSSLSIFIIRLLAPL
mgnify:CR=1 FL=1